MKHYKLMCSKRTEDDYTSGSIFVEIYCQGNNYFAAIQDAYQRLYDNYEMNIDIFDNINMSYQWSDTDANA